MTARSHTAGLTVRRPRLAAWSGNRLRLVLAGALCVGASVLTSGCSSVGAASGAAAGVASGLVTSNPAVGIGIGIAVQAATDEAVGRYMRTMHTPISRT
jgi:hypothetical protein